MSRRRRLVLLPKICGSSQMATQNSPRFRMMLWITLTVARTCSLVRSFRILLQSALCTRRSFRLRLQNQAESILSQICTESAFLSAMREAALSSTRSRFLRATVSHSTTSKRTIFLSKSLLKACRTALSTLVLSRRAFRTRLCRSLLSRRVSFSFQ